MGVGGISDYSSLFANYRVPSIPTVEPEQLKKAAEVQAATQQPIDNQTIQTAAPSDISLSIEEAGSARKPSLDVKDMSLSFNASEDYGYIGKDSNIEDLDMQKAISDMKKDQVLQQYQYFVGKTENLFQNQTGDDGIVFLKF